MSLERSTFNGPITFCCDSCGEVEDTELNDFSEALSFIKRLGWKVRKVVDEWMHFCKDCNP